MADLQKARWAQQAIDKVVSLRRGARNVAAQIITFKGQINALSVAEKTKLREGVDALGVSGTDLLAELNGMETVANNIMATVNDTKDI